MEPKTYREKKTKFIGCMATEAFVEIVKKRQEELGKKNVTDYLRFLIENDLKKASGIDPERVEDDILEKICRSYSGALSTRVKKLIEKTTLSQPEILDQMLRDFLQKNEAFGKITRENRLDSSVKIYPLNE